MLVFRLLVWLAVVGIVFITVATLLSDYRQVLQLIISVSPGWLALIIASVLFNYVLRFAKWNYFLRLLNIEVPLRLNLWVFFSAFTMVLSPAKLGEVVKSFLLKTRLGIAVSRTAPIVMAERLTDLIGLLILCALGFSRFAFGGNTLLITGIIIFAGVWGMTRPRFWAAIDRFLGRYEILHRFQSPVRAIQASTSSLLSLRSLAISVPVSAVSWAGEGVALYLIFRAMGLDMPNLLAISIFAHAFGSIAGALSFLPGGLLVTEGAMSMFFLYVAVPGTVAVSATFLIRAVTLWFAVILGMLVFIAGHRKSDLLALQSSSDRDTSATDSQEKYNGNA